MVLNMLQELKETRRTMSQQIENINTQRQKLEKGNKEILDLKSLITELKISLEGFSRFEQAEKPANMNTDQLETDQSKK